MTTKQVSFRDEEDTLNYGIQVKTDENDWFIICACCGTIFEPDDVYDVQPLNHWADFSEHIR